MALSKGSSSRLSWLMASWAEQRFRAAQFLGRITDLGPLQAMKPSALRNFLKFMEQVGEAKQEEAKIINEIDAIEREHHFRRKHQQLKKALPADELDNANDDISAEERPKHPWAWLLLLAYLMRSKRINKKSHELTGD